MFSFTHQIWKTFKETAVERANYLWKSYFTLVLASERHVHPPICFYLDIGAGKGYNTLRFGKNANEILAIDLHFSQNNPLKDSKKTCLVVADTQFLPLRKERFDRVSLFSVIEHVEDQELALREALRVLKVEGELIIQIPNRFFPIELHSGLPFVFLFPPKIMNFVLKTMRYEWLSRIDIPSLTILKRMIWRIEPEVKIAVKKLSYPPSLVWSKLRPLYRLAQKLQIINWIPLGYLMITKK